MSDAPPADRRSTPALLKRAWTYALAWLPPLAVVIWLLPLFVGILKKHDEAGNLTELTHWTFAFVQLNGAWYYLPSIFAFVGAVAAAEAFLHSVYRAGLDHSAGRVWLVSVVCLGLLALSILLAALLQMPVFVNHGTGN
jgi:hypothetical protein